MRNKELEKNAKLAADFITSFFKKHGNAAKQNANPPVGLILGTGWGDVLKIENATAISFKEIPGFTALDVLEGHARQLIIGNLAGREVFVLRGRIHMNESPSNQDLAKMVRLQMEMMLQLGVKTFILTSAVGGLRGALKVGQIAAVNGFVTLYAPEMPLWAGEFCSPEDVLSEKLRKIASEECGELTVKEAGHVMVRGPFFEGRKYDKALLAASGAGVVGMSMLPEACIAALYENTEVLGLGFVTNDDIATHSHEENLAQAKTAAAHLGDFLARIVKRI